MPLSIKLSIMKNFSRLIVNWIARIGLLNSWKSNPSYSNKMGKKIKLIYRGVSYEYNPPNVQVAEGEIGGKYRGSAWRFHLVKKSLIQITQQSLNYRGTKYSQELIQIKISDTLSSQDTELFSIQSNKKEIIPPEVQKPIEVILGESSAIIPTIKPRQTPKQYLVLDKEIFKNKRITTSGEAEIWTITGESLVNNPQNYLAKIYYQETPEQIEHLTEREKKLEVMVFHFPTASKSLAWPQYLLENISGKVVGFLMPFIEGNKLTKVYHPKLRQSLNFEWDWQVDWQFLHLTARNLALIIQSLHAEGYIVGDLKQENILVNHQALPSIIDTDSFQIHHLNTGEIYRCLVGSEGYTPPELLGKNFAQIDQNPTHDNFRVGVIIYHLLFGEHPFKGHWRGDEDPPEIDELVRQCFWPYANNSLIQPGKITIPLDIVHPQVKECFLRCFNEGHHNPNMRPDATDWVRALQSAFDDLVQCEKSSNHWYSRIYGRCYWCERKRSLGKDIFPDNVQYKRLKRLLKAGKWKEADLETKYLMLKITNRIDKGWLDESAIKSFPLQDLNIIDQLWQDHSSGRFGFSVQKRIYLETGNQPGGYNRETYNRFGEEVGWRGNGIWKNYYNLEFSLSAYEGHLPFFCAGFDVCLVSHLAWRFE